MALLRRTAHVNRDPSRKDDETLVRHVYDLHMATAGGYDMAALRPLVQAVIQTDVSQFGNQHTQFVTSPADELLYGLGAYRPTPSIRIATSVLSARWFITMSRVLG